MMTLNPDDPNLPIYDEFINCCRPLEKYKKDVPAEILGQLNSEEKPNWTYWFFTFYDNASLDEEAIVNNSNALEVIYMSFKRKLFIIVKGGNYLAYSKYKNSKKSDFKYFE